MAAAAAEERSAIALGHTKKTRADVPLLARVQKVLTYLAHVSWPVQLDHWGPLSIHLITDMSDLFIYSDSREIGKAAEAELLSTPTRTKNTLL